MTGATALVLDRPGARLRRRVWTGLLAGLAAVCVTAVSIPLLATLYQVFVPVAFLIAVAHGAAVVLAVSRPGLAIGISGWSVLAIAVLGAGATGLPWPLPVTTLITQVIVCTLIGLRGDVGTAVTALLVSLAAAAAPLVLTVADPGLWPGAAANLVTFSSVAVLATVAALLVATAGPRATVGE